MNSKTKSLFSCKSSLHCLMAEKIRVSIRVMDAMLSEKTGFSATDEAWLENKTC